MSKKDAGMKSGGYLREIPKPHVRMFADKRRRRKVSVTIGVFYGIGHHYHVTMSEEDNPIWNCAENCWQFAWDDKNYRGRIETGIFGLETQAIDYVKRTARRYFPKHSHRLTKPFSSSRFFYKEEGA
jgi:hypothetical protein